MSPLIEEVDEDNLEIANHNKRNSMDSIKKNIRRCEKMYKKDLNDSRNDDFEGFDEDYSIKQDEAEWELRFGINKC